ncbi:hypothetical protein BHM03_00006004, partial [Ensete ventricosum]
WKKEKVSRVSRWSLSHNEALGEAGGGRSEEEGARFWPMHTTSTSTGLTYRKRARLDRKNGCVGSAALKHEVQYLEHNSESSTKVVCREGIDHISQMNIPHAK